MQLLRALKLLWCCGFSTGDVCSILAHASVYFRDARAACGDTIGPSEVGNVLAISIFLAQSYIQDEVCPLHVWHEWLFKRCCTLQTLNSGVMRVLELRGYILRVDEHERNERYRILVHAATFPAAAPGKLASTPDPLAAEEQLALALTAGQPTACVCSVWAWLLCPLSCFVGVLPQRCRPKGLATRHTTSMQLVASD